MHHRLQTMEGLERAGVLGTYPPCDGTRIDARIGDQTSQVILLGNLSEVGTVS